VVRDSGINESDHYEILHLSKYTVSAWVQSLWLIKVDFLLLKVYVPSLYPKSKV
jgi:hypothetical protein